MTGKNTNPDRLRREWLGKIEQIVETQLNNLVANESESSQKGSQLKVTEIKALIELHTKLSDQKAGTSEFWDMIEKIRKAKLPGGELPAADFEETAAPEGEEAD